MAAADHLFIGDVAALTGISAGRIRHYETIGLLSPGHLPSGYRTFSPEDLVVLLRIDLLRSIGMGIAEIRACLQDDPGDLRRALAQHRAVLEAERHRLDQLVAAVDEALGAGDRDVAASIATLAGRHRDNVGGFGRLVRPLSDQAAGAYAAVFARWDLAVPPLFGRMLLPGDVTDFLEALAGAPGYELLFERLRELARQVTALTAADGPAVAPLARRWVDHQLGDPLPTPVAGVLRDWVPRLSQSHAIRQGLLAVSGSFSPLGSQVMMAIEAEAAARGADVLAVIVVPRPTPVGRCREGPPAGGTTGGRDLRPLTG